MGKNTEELAGLGLRAVRVGMFLIWFQISLGLFIFSVWPWVLHVPLVALIMDVLGAMCLLRAFAALSRKGGEK